MGVNYSKKSRLPVKASGSLQILVRDLKPSLFSWLVSGQTTITLEMCYFLIEPPVNLLQGPDFFKIDIKIKREVCKYRWEVIDNALVTDDYL